MWISPPTSSADGYARMAMSIALASWLLLIGTRLESPYPETLVEAYALPITRIALLILVLLAASWCPTVGILAAFSYVTLGADVLFFTHGAQILPLPGNSK